MSAKSEARFIMLKMLSSTNEWKAQSSKASMARNDLLLAKKAFDEQQAEMVAADNIVGRNAEIRNAKAYLMSKNGHLAIERMTCEVREEESLAKIMFQNMLSLRTALRAYGVALEDDGVGKEQPEDNDDGFEDLLSWLD